MPSQFSLGGRLVIFWSPQISSRRKLCAKRLFFLLQIPPQQKAKPHCFVTFQPCAFSSVSSNGLHEKRHIHTGRICLSFLHCGFSNVSSNCLPEKRQIHIGCICFTFSHVFSNVSPMHLQSKHIYIGCIC